MNMDSVVGFEDNLIHFSWSLYGVLGRNETVCISPYSITAALFLVMLGAHGGTKSEIKSALLKKNNEITDIEALEKYKSLNNEIISRAGGNVTIATANRLFVSEQFSVVQKVRSQAKYYFGADISIMDFTKPKLSADMINTWVSNQTNNKIKNLVQEGWMDALTVMFIINVVYFKATWEEPFIPELTAKTEFYVNKTKTIKVDMMHLKSYVKHTQNIDFGFSAIALPFKEGKFEMLFILPEEKNGLPGLESRINMLPHYFNGLLLDNQKSYCSIGIPKFTVQSEINLKDSLPNIGIKEMFDQFRANFSELIEESQRNIFVDRAIHKVFLAVNEFGVEGTAATAVGLSLRSSGEPFIADHPFLFYVRELKTRIILFLGKYQPKIKQ